MFDIDREHPEYTREEGDVEEVQGPVRGRRAVARRTRAEYLVRRHKEPLDVYSERLSRVFYENYLGSIIDWYAATLFRREPMLLFEGTNEAGEGVLQRVRRGLRPEGARTCPTSSGSGSGARRWYAGRRYMLVDFPRSTEPAANRAEEDALGRSRAYLVEYSRRRTSSTGATTTDGQSRLGGASGRPACGSAGDGRRRLESGDAVDLLRPRGISGSTGGLRGSRRPGDRS